MCVGKALTGGYLTLAAALCTPEVARGISAGEVPVLAHGPTFMGNPLACAVANASHRAAARPATGRATWRGSRPACGPAWRRCAGAPGVADVRVLGAIGVVQLDHDGGRAGGDRRRGRRTGVWLRPFRDLIYTMPPYVTDDGRRRPDHPCDRRGGRPAS